MSDENNGSWINEVATWRICKFCKKYFASSQKLKEHKLLIHADLLLDRKRKKQKARKRREKSAEKKSKSATSDASKASNEEVNMGPAAPAPVGIDLTAGNLMDSLMAPVVSLVPIMDTLKLTNEDVKHRQGPATSSPTTGDMTTATTGVSAASPKRAIRNCWYCAKECKAFQLYCTHDGRSRSNSQENHPFICPVCSKGYKYEKPFKTHLLTKHPNQITA